MQSPGTVLHCFASLLQQGVAAQSQHISTARETGSERHGCKIQRCGLHRLGVWMPDDAWSQHPVQAACPALLHHSSAHSSQILVTQGSLNRRTRFIMGASLALGVGVELVPQWGESVRE
jgi:hypothetical protein